MWYGYDDENMYYCSSEDPTTKEVGTIDMNVIMMPLAMTIRLVIMVIFFAVWLISKIIWFHGVLAYNRKIHQMQHIIPSCFNDGRLKQNGSGVRERYQVTEEGKLVKIE